jgi:hypothetical protein
MSVSRQFSQTFVRYDVSFARVPGSNPMFALFLSYVAFRCADGRKAKQTHGTCEQFTGLSRFQQDRAAEFWEAQKVLQKWIEGTPPAIHYGVDFDRIDQLLEGLDANLQETRKCKKLASDMQETRKRTCKKLANSLVEEELVKEKGEPPATDRKKPFKAPTREEWFQHCSSAWPMWDSAAIHGSFEYYSQNEWRKANGSKLSTWKGAAATSFHGWLARNPNYRKPYADHVQRKPGQGAQVNAVTPGRMSPLDLIQERAKNVA